MKTPHIDSDKSKISKVVLMPGDPLRALYIATNYLKDYEEVNSIRGMKAYTGKYKDILITIFASGMGCPSMGIYSYELYKFYDVDVIIRIGTAGAYTKDLNLKDLLLVNNSYSLSSYAKELCDYQNNCLTASSRINIELKNQANLCNLVLKEADVCCSDSFYKEASFDFPIKNNCQAVEMESFALFANAKLLNKECACILSISDNLVTKEELDAADRQTSLDEMIILGLETAIKLLK